jgi:Leucine-rich repeat (LRR) protein
MLNVLKIFAPGIVGICLLSISLAGSAALGEPAPGGSCQGRAVVDFCKQKLPLNSTRVSCYERRGLAPQIPALDLTPLTCLPALTTLSLSSGEIEFIQRLKVGELTPLLRLPQLTHLVLEETQLTELAPLASLTRLQVLSLHASPVKNLRPLAGLEQLRQLDLSCTEVSDLAPLQSLKGLESLDLTNAPVRDLEPLASLAQLKWLGLSDASPITQAQRLALLKRLPGLKISEGRKY